MNNHYRFRKDKSKLSSSWKLPIKDGHYVKVYIWEDDDAMSENVLPGDDPEWEGGKYAACFLAMDGLIQDGERLIPVFYGEMHLVLGKFGSGVVAHEIMHCILNWIRDFELTDDEEICIITGQMNAKFWETFYKHYAEK